MKNQSIFLKILILILFVGCTEFDSQPSINEEVALEEAKAPTVPFTFRFDVQLDEVMQDVPPGQLHQVLIGSGNATHMGLTTFRLEEVIDLTVEPWTAGAEVVFTGANGDELWVEYGSSIDHSDLPDLVIEGAGTFTGGTGRFENCGGNLIVIASYNIFDESGEGTFLGTLVKN